MTATRHAHDVPTRPRLRPRLAASEDESRPGRFYLWDQFRLGRPVSLSRTELFCAQLFNGRRDPRDVQAEVAGRGGGLLVTTDALLDLAARLDEALLLDSPRFADYLEGPIREPTCIGCYPEDPVALRSAAGELFTAEGGPGLPGSPGRSPRPPGRLRAVLVPHMDYARGGVTYGWGFRELAEATDATLFVIVATSHYSPARFTLTRKHFKTPLGVARTDAAYVDRLAELYGDGLFDDATAHLPEHSIELEVVLLQYLFEGRRDFRIVPLLVGSFHDCVADGEDPAGRDDVRRMIAALRRAEADLGGDVCYIISGDLAHIGPKFGDPSPVDEPWLSRSRRGDEAILARLEAADARGYFRAIAAERDARRICGLSPTYTALAALRPGSARVLHYGRYVAPDGQESVSFASAAFYE